MPRLSRHVAPTLVDAVRALEGDAARGFVFVRSDGTERLRSFQEMAAEAGHRAASLAALGLKKGDRVALVIPDGEEFVLSLLGTLFAGLVPVPLSPQLSMSSLDAYHATVAHITRAAGAAILLTTAAARAYLVGFEGVAGQVEGLRGIVTVEELAASNQGETMCASVTPDDLALIQFTSGSTSRPKGVTVTHGNLAANAEAFMIHGLDRDPSVDKGVSWLPLFHDMGLIGFVVGPLFTNVPCVLLPAASFARRPRLWLDKIHQHRGTITYAPNFAYALVAKRLKGKDVQDLDLSSLRVSGCGAEPIQASVLREFAETLAPAHFDRRAFLPSYGMAEATLAITFTPLKQGLRTDAVDAQALADGRALASDPVTHEEPTEIVDCGAVFPGHELAIIDAAGARLADRQVGQIVARGPSVTQGYFHEPVLTAQTFKPIEGDAPGDAPWLHTGDLGYLAGGRLFVCGRVKDVIIVRGRNYYPSDIEWAVSEASGAAAASATTATRRGNVVAFGVFVDAHGRASAGAVSEEQLVVCCEGHSSEVDAIRETATAVLASRFGLAVHEVVVAPLASLPRTSSGKPKRRETRQRYLDGSLPRARGVQTPQSQTQHPDDQGPGLTG
ncbi:MAG TPA: fatty acyl-AMP ligase [Polyangiaceae bacterium]|nr:fatty acyl-AMP ligase [Polyangiaceae bacterium]